MKKSLADRIEERMQELGLNVSTAAKRVGKSRDLIRPMLINRERIPRADNLSLIAKALETTPEWLLTGKDAKEAGTQATEQGFTRLNTDHFFENPVSLPIWGEVAAGLWLEVDQLQEQDDLKPSRLLPHPSYPAEAQYVLTVRGESLNLDYPDGSELLCVNLYKANISEQDLRDGDLVIVQRYRPGSNMRETTAKYIFFNRAKNYFELTPNSTDPRHQLPLIVGNGEAAAIEQLPQEENEEIRVLAVVVDGRHPPKRKIR